MGQKNLFFDLDSLTLYYRGVVWDEFYRQESVLQKMSVSQGIMHYADLEQECDQFACYKKIDGSEYREVSLVFFPGFTHASINIEPNTSLSVECSNPKLMSEKNSGTECNDCQKNKSLETQQTDTGVKAGGIPSVGGQCGEGKVWDELTQSCVDASQQPPLESSAPGVEQSPKEDDDKDKDEAKEALDKVKALEAEIAEMRLKGSFPNADIKSREKANEEYIAEKQKKLDAMEAKATAAPQHIPQKATK